MADTTQVPMNGTFPAQPAYTDFNPVQGTMNATAFQQTQSSTPSNVPPAGEMKNGLSKDEVGWYFVEQYYTNMSRCPDKLHHFYSRRSQFVFGAESEPIPVAVGQKAINDKIKQLDFQECKVRVLNVDSQASFDNILITVIGEISNKSEPSRKFVQTFVLAEQPNGYYVLNDIFRYLTEEDEEVSNEEPAPAAELKEAPEAPAEPAAPEVAATSESADAQVDNEPAAHKVDEKLEEAQPNGETTTTAQPKAAEQTNGETGAQEAPEVPAPAADTESVQTEYPASPQTTPTPAEPKEPPSSKEETTPVPAATPAKAVPKTWATIASKSSATAPVVPAIPVAPKAPASNSPQPAAPAQLAGAPTAATTAAAAPASAAPAESTSSQPTSNDNSGWQTAGPDHKKTLSRAGDEQHVLAYIKNVNDKVDASVLRQTLSRFGKLKYFDVSRQKNCAFVEFSEPAGYAAAVAANPHQIGSEQITVEERRPRGNAYGGNTGFGPSRGGSGRGRGDRAGSQGRGGFQRDGRGGFAPRGRGGNPGPKGRNQAQAA